MNDLPDFVAFPVLESPKRQLIPLNPQKEILTKNCILKIQSIGKQIGFPFTTIATASYFHIVLHNTTNTFIHPFVEFELKIGLNYYLSFDCFEIGRYC